MILFLSHAPFWVEMMEKILNGEISAAELGLDQQQASSGRKESSSANNDIAQRIMQQAQANKPQVFPFPIFLLAEKCDSRVPLFQFTHVISRVNMCCS